MGIVEHKIMIRWEDTQDFKKGYLFIILLYNYYNIMYSYYG